MALVPDDTSTRSARDYIATLALSIYQIHGLPAPGADELGSIVFRAEAGMSHHQLRHPESISSALIGQIDQLVMSAADTKKRSTNIYSADAARGGPGGDGSGKAPAKGLDALDRLRALPSSVRYNDLPAGEGSGGSFIGERGMAGVPQEFIRAFAGAGVGRDSIKAFAAVGLDRGTFDHFRHEGYSAKQIVDNAKDTKILGGRGKDDLNIGQHAPTDLRKAFVRDKIEHSPESHENRDRVKHKYEALPDSDPRKAGALRFIRRYDNDALKLDQKAGLGSSAGKDDNALKPASTGAGPSVVVGQDQNAAKLKKVSVASLNANDQDDWGASAAPDPKKPEPAKGADAKPDPKKPAPIKAADAKPPSGPTPT